MKFIDTHAHLDFFQDNNTLPEMFERAKLSGVYKIITCSARKCDWANYFKLAKEHKGKVFWQFGIHPTEVEESDFEILEKSFEDYMNSDLPPISVGEIGLDFYRLPQDEFEISQIKKTQESIFRLQLNLAKKANLPICVHARSAISESVQIMKEENFDFSKSVFHCFSGGLKEIEVLNSLGARASFTGIITYKNAEEMRSVMLAQGLEKIMFETDCPYLAPTPHRGKDNEPSYIPLIAKKAAELFNISEKEMAQISTENAESFFKI